MLKKISSFELCQIIEFTPDNLKNFFDAAIHVDDSKQVPKVGILADSPSFLFDSKDKLNYNKDLRGIMTWRGMSKDYKVAEELPTVLYKIGIKYNFEIGSESSLDLHIALS